MEIIPSVLAKNEEELAEIKKKLDFYSGPLHIDIGDGQFVSTITVGREEIERAFLRQLLDVHLMVSNPGDVIPLWMDIPNLRTIIFHIESTDKAPEIIDTVIKGNAKLAGVAINPETDLSTLNYVINMADVVHVMTVHPGDYGGKFLPAAVSKIRDIRAKHPTIKISVDGGINKDNIGLLAKVGVSACVVGSAILQSDNPEQEFKNLSI